MKINEAKKITKNFLDKNGAAYTGLKAKTVSFSDLARSEMIFVTVQGFSGACASDLEKMARENGFRVTFSGFIS